jgi:hypothetical protein
MSRIALQRAGTMLVLALSIASCSDDGDSPKPTPDSGWPGDWPDENDAGHDAGTTADAARPVDIDAGADAAVVDAAQPLARTGCLDRPTSLPESPAGPLSCELLPPGLTL